MELDQRKVVILTTIIKNYLETGEPVGSRTISKYSGLSLSSATIRNEMSDLEEMGYIMQPHTSAGRIPSDKGYRFYVDQLMEHHQHEIDDVKTEMFEKVDKLETTLKQLVKNLAQDTNYAAVVTEPSIPRSSIITSPRSSWTRASKPQDLAGKHWDAQREGTTPPKRKFSQSG